MKHTTTPSGPAHEARPTDQQRTLRAVTVILLLAALAVMIDYGIRGGAAPDGRFFVGFALAGAGIFVNALGNEAHRHEDTREENITDE